MLLYRRNSSTAGLRPGNDFLSFLLILISVFEIIPLFLSSANIEKGSIYFTNAYAALRFSYGTFYRDMLSGA